MSIYLKGSDR